MRAMKNQMPKQQLMNEMERLESQIHQQAANQPITPKKKTMIIVKFKSLRNLPGNCENSISLRN